MTLDEYLAGRRRAVDEALGRLLPSEDACPPGIHDAMRYSVFAGGKRIRPILAIAAAEAVSGEPAGVGVVDSACALEMVHAYSLIHDDLPALDNDDFRRGKPSCHKAFGEALAILAGDALLTRAFQTIAEADAIPAERRNRMAAELARAAGTVDGMIGGQVADLEAEGKPVEAERLHYIHRAKTGALITAAVRIGGLYAGADEGEYEALGVYGRHAGLAFQIVDDVLDVTGGDGNLGKTAGKDAARKKATFPALYGVDESLRIARRHKDEAVEAIAAFGGRARRLREIAERIVERSR